MTIQQLLLVLVARWRLAALMLLASLCAVLVVTLLQAPLYTANTTILVDTGNRDPMTGSASPQINMSNFLATQADLLGSRHVATLVVEGAGLEKDPALKARFEKTWHGTQTFKEWLAERLLKSQRIDSARDSSVIDVAIEDEDPVRAARLANGFADAFLSASLALRTEPARQGSAWLEQQLSAQRAELDHAKALQTEFQREHGILLADDKDEFGNAQLAEAHSQLLRADAELFELQARRREALRHVGASRLGLPEVQSNPAVQAIQTELARARERAEELTVRTGANHPDYEKAKTGVARLQAQLDAEVGRVLAAGNSALSAAVARRASLQAAVDAKDAALLKAKSERDELARLKHDVETAQQSYDSLLQKLTQVRLQSQSAQAGALVVNRAVTPAKPSNRRLGVRLAAGTLMGLLLALGAVLGMEALDRRLRSEAAVTASTGLPVLAVLEDRPLHRRLHRVAAPPGAVRSTLAIERDYT